MVVVTILALMGGLLLFGVPVAFALGIAGVAGLWWIGGTDTLMGLLAATPYRQSASWILTAIPLFVLMAEMLATSRITGDLFGAARKWVGHLPGGVAIAAILAAAGLGAVSGSSTAATAALSRSVVPELLRQGYARSLAVGTVASAGTLAIMIPPSVILVIYGILTETSIGKLFVAGILPGMLTVVAYSATVVLVVRRNPLSAPPSLKVSASERLSALRGVWPMLVLFGLVIGTLYAGIVTVTESAALGAAGAILLAFAFVRQRFFPALREALDRTARTTAMIFAIIIGAHLFGYFMTLTGVTKTLLDFVAGLDVAPGIIVFIVLTIYVILGCFMDQLAILVLTIPIVFPMMLQLGYDPIWLGIVLTKTVEIGLITPPLGMNCFVASSLSETPLSQVFRGVTPFLAAELVVLVLVAAVPALATWVN